jgi:CheY-like chemotaxis protein
MGRAQLRLTVVDDSPELLALFGDALRSLGVSVALFDELATLQDLEESAPDLLVIDLRLSPGSLTGIEMIRLLRAHRHLQRVPTIVCSAALDDVRQHQEELNRMPALFVLPKPFSLEDLESCVGEALGYRDEVPPRPPLLPAAPLAGVREPTLG